MMLVMVMMIPMMAMMILMMVMMMLMMVMMMMTVFLNFDWLLAEPQPNGRRCRFGLVIPLFLVCLTSPVSYTHLTLPTKA